MGKKHVITTYHFYSNANYMTLPLRSLNNCAVSFCTACLPSNQHISRATRKKMLNEKHTKRDTRNSKGEKTHWKTLSVLMPVCGGTSATSSVEPMYAYMSLKLLLIRVFASNYRKNKQKTVNRSQQRK